MIDPFNPVKITAEAIKVELPEYYMSWQMSDKNVQTV